MARGAGPARDRVLLGHQEHVPGALHYPPAALLLAWYHQSPGLLVMATGHIHVPQLRAEGQRGHLGLGHKTNEDLPDLHQYDMATGTISLATAFRHQAAKESSHQQAESFPGLTGGICPSAWLMHSKPLSSGGKQGIDKGMRWVKIITA